MRNFENCSYCGLSHRLTTSTYCPNIACGSVMNVKFLRTVKFIRPDTGMLGISQFPVIWIEWPPFIEKWVEQVKVIGRDADWDEELRKAIEKSIRKLKVDLASQKFGI